MSRIGLGLVIVTLVMMTSGTAFSFPSMSGPTGLATLPTASVEPKGKLDIAADFVTMDGEDVPSVLRGAIGGGIGFYSAGSGGSLDSNIGRAGGLYLLEEDLDVIPIRAVYGVTRRAELWGASLTVQNNIIDSDGFGVGGKYQVWSQSKHGVDVAVGFSHQELNDVFVTGTIVGGSLTSPVFADAEVNSEYIVATRDYTRGRGSGLRVHLGLIRSDYDVDGGPDATIFEPYAGAEWVLSGERLVVGAEFRPEDSSIDDKALSSVFVRFRAWGNVTVEAGLTNGALLGIAGDGHSFYGGVGIRI